MTVSKSKSGDGVSPAMEKIVDVTEGVNEYRKGKTFECECGQGFGVEYGVESITCPSCRRVVVDSKGGDREPPEVDKEQTSLGDWS